MLESLLVDFFPHGSNSIFGLHLATKLKIHGSVEPSPFPVVWLVS